MKFIRSFMINHSHMNHVLYTPHYQLSCLNPHFETIPPKITNEDPLCGFTPENVKDSFFWSTLSVLALYSGGLKETIESLRLKAVKSLKSSILNAQLKDFTFNLNYNDYDEFLTDFKGIG